MGRGLTGERLRADEVVVAGWATSRHVIRRWQPLIEAMQLLRASPGLRMIAVVDDDQQPCGALYERDMRALLFNPFGHALLSNRGLSIGLETMLAPCPTVEIGSPIPLALDRWSAQDGAEGLVLTAHGRFVGIVDQASLLRLAAQRDIEAAAARAERADRIDRATEGFERDARNLAADLASASAAVAEASRRMATRASDIGTRTAAVAAASSQAASGMAEIAIRSRDFAGALGTVEQRMDAAQEATRGAVAVTASGATQVAALARATDSIGSVSQLIDTIARQTTMLALNASMEAARAGEAGRGFTTVAQAVKALADQTRTAAGEIAEDVTRIRGAIDEVSLGHAGLVSAVGAVEALSSSVMAAVREQGETGRVISLNVAEASGSTEEIDASATAMLAGAQAADEDAAMMRDLAGRLAEKAAALNRHLAGFLAEVHAA